MLNTGRTLVTGGMAVFVLALAAFAWSAYHGFQTVSSRAMTDVPEATSAQQTASRESHQDYSISTIIDAHIFGEVSEPVEEQAAHAPETNLQIRLLGLVASANPRLSRAIIDVDGAKLKPYSVGQTVEGTDAVIHAVENSRVLLKRGGALESLALKRQDGAGSTHRQHVTPASGNNATPPNDDAQRKAGTGSEAAFREKVETDQMKLPF